MASDEDICMVKDVHFRTFFRTVETACESNSKNRKEAEKVFSLQCGTEFVEKNNVLEWSSPRLMDIKLSQYLM